jgi:Holliday junction DNA helicase RuvA
MIAYLNGKLAYKNPTYVVIDINGLGYKVNISLNTYSSVQNLESARLFTSMVVKNEGQNLSGFDLYGFAEESERELFELLISVNGVGASTARVMLSSFKPEDIRNAILSENEGLIQSIKGIGPKTAKRVILELKDKVVKSGGSAGLGALPLTNTPHNTNRDEALSALVALGFQKQAAEKVLMKIVVSNSGAAVEVLIKEALKQL